MSKRTSISKNKEIEKEDDSKIKKVKGKSWGDSFEFSVFHNIIGPLFLMITTPMTIIFVWIICTRFEGSIWKMINGVKLEELTSLSYYPLPSLLAAKIILGFAAMEAFFQFALPGRIFYGPVTRTGYRPSYKLNGVLSFFLTHIVLYLLTIHYKLFSLAIVYDNFGSILSTLSLTSLCVCLLLYYKGLHFPSSNDSGSSGNPIMDFFLGNRTSSTNWFLQYQAVFQL